MASSMNVLHLFFSKEKNAVQGLTERHYGGARIYPPAINLFIGFYFFTGLGEEALIVFFVISGLCVSSFDTGCPKPSFSMERSIATLPLRVSM
ncbi:hypothetical protein ACFS07_02155 [Undibacterium arcticum]